MKNLNLNEMEKVNGGGWFTQMFGRDWDPCVQFTDSPGVDGACAQHGTSWLWGSGSRSCTC